MGLIFSDTGDPVKTKTGPRQDLRGIHAGRVSGELGNGNPPLPSAIPSQRRTTVSEPPQHRTRPAWMPHDIRGDAEAAASWTACSPAATFRKPALLALPRGAAASSPRSRAAATGQSGRSLPQSKALRAVSAPPAAEVGADARRPTPSIHHPQPRLPLPFLRSLRSLAAKNTCLPFPEAKAGPALQASRLQDQRPMSVQSAVHQRMTERRSARKGGVTPPADSPTPARLSEDRAPYLEASPAAPRRGGFSIRPLLNIPASLREAFSKSGPKFTSAAFCGEDQNH